MHLSRFGQRFTQPSGIAELMEDLGRALAGGGDTLMLGGGNPAHIPALEALFRAELAKLSEAPERFARVFADYSPPQGEGGFIEALAGLLRQEYGWDLGPENIALTSGSQLSFFMLFNLFAGKGGEGTRKKILLPLCPEYIGYTDLCADPDGILARRPLIDLCEGGIDLRESGVDLSEGGIDLCESGIDPCAGRRFKYRVSFEDLEIGEDIGAVCLSRPTNPSGNVISDLDLKRLATLAQSHEVPLIVDGAYGPPFPSILFRDITPLWNDSMVLSLSLSKLGLPGVRSGIVIARPEIIAAVARMNAILALAPGGIGPAILYDLVRNGAIIRIAREIIQPYYAARLRDALGQLSLAFEGLPYRVHEPEGAMFLWLWFPDLPISTRTLYARLKDRGVLIVPGEHFFPGLPRDFGTPPWRHTEECIRVHYAQPPRVVEQGFTLLGEELRRAYA
ncbi:MAG: pyridoxal phosphate-dependent aminotransferase [Gammaproteobacteria bacterium]